MKWFAQQIAEFNPVLVQQILDTCSPEEIIDAAMSKRKYHEIEDDK